MPDADIEFFWDPICPFAWLTSRWVSDVARQRDYAVDWRLICLSILNEDSDYEDFPEGYQDLHHKGRRMLRVAQAVRDRHGATAAGELYTAYGSTIWNPRCGCPLDDGRGGLRPALEGRSRASWPT